VIVCMWWQCESMYVCGGCNVSQCMYVVDFSIHYYTCVCMWRIRQGESMYVCDGLGVNVCMWWRCESLYVCGGLGHHINAFSLRGGLGYVSQCIYVRA